MNNDMGCECFEILKIESFILNLKNKEDCWWMGGYFLRTEICERDQRREEVYEIFIEYQGNKEVILAYNY